MAHFKSFDPSRTTVPMFKAMFKIAQQAQRERSERQSEPLPAQDRLNATFEAWSKE